MKGTLKITKILSSLLLVAAALLSPTASAQVTNEVKIEVIPAVRLSFDGVPGIDYMLQTTTNLQDGNWSNLAIIEANGSKEYAYTNCPGPGPIFYRTVALLGRHIGVRLDDVSPPDETAQIFQSMQTPGILLGIFDITSYDVTSHMLAVQFDVTTTGNSIASLFANFQLVSPAYTAYASAVIVSGMHARIIFNNLPLILPSNIRQQFKLVGTANPDYTGSLNGSTVQVSLVASNGVGNASGNPLAIDSAFNNVPVVASTNPASSVLLWSADIQLSQLNTWTSPVVVNNQVVAANVSFEFIMTALNNPVYLSTNVNDVLSLVLSPGALFAPNAVTRESASNPGDGPGFFVISPGTSRAFVASGVLSDVLHTGGVRSVSAVEFHYGNSSTNLTNKTIKYGLGNLRADVLF